MADAHELPNAWLLDPAGNLVTFLSNEIIVAALSKKAILLTQATPWLFRAAAKGMQSDNKAGLAAIGRLMKEADSDSAFAAAEAATGFTTIASHSAVAIWAAIETAIEQTLLNHIRKLSNAADLMIVSAPSLKMSKLQTSTEAGMRQALRRWEGAVDEQDAVARALLMLAAMKVEVLISEDVRRHLTEMGEIRNVLMHRGGVADGWFVTKCPWLGLQVGEAVALNEQKLGKYIDAARIFAVELMRGCAGSPFAYKAPSNAQAV